MARIITASPTSVHVLPEAHARMNRGDHTTTKARMFGSSRCMGVLRARVSQTNRPTAAMYVPCPPLTSQQTIPCLNFHFRPLRRHLRTQECVHTYMRQKIMSQCQQNYEKLAVRSCNDQHQRHQMLPERLGFLAAGGNHFLGSSLSLTAPQTHCHVSSIHGEENYRVRTNPLTITASGSVP